MLKTKKQRYLLGIVVFFLLLFFGFQFLKNRNGKLSTEKIVIGGKTFEVEIAREEKDLEKGLGERDQLCDECGMLFEFPHAGQYAFWMKGMRFSLDIIWILDNKIVHIEKNVQPSFSGTLGPEQEADKVLEINAGKSDALGIKAGDGIDF